MDSLNEISYLANEESTIIEEEINVLEVIPENSHEMETSIQVKMISNYVPYISKNPDILYRWRRNQSECIMRLPRLALAYVQSII